MIPSGVPTWLLRIVVAVGLAGAAGLTFAGAWQRWWPACPRGGFDSDACLRLQSQEYFQLPGDPWLPVGQAAELYGGALLALAAAVAVLFVAPRPSEEAQPRVTAGRRTARSPL